MTFKLIAFLIMFGDVHAFELDSDMSYEDCQQATVSGVQTAILFEGLEIDLSGAAFVCELDN